MLNDEIIWEGIGLNEVGRLKSTNKVVIMVDENYYRPNEVDLLIGDYSKAHTELGWKPKTKFHGLVRKMVLFDFERLKNIK